MYDQLIRTQTSAAKMVCERLSPPRLKALHESLAEACQLPADSGWERKAAAHAAFFTVLAETACDPVIAPALVSGGELAYDLMVRAGRGADCIVTNSRRRFLECLRTGDAEGAASEVEEHFRILRFMCRLTGQWHDAGHDSQPSQQDRLLTQSEADS